MNVVVRTSDQAPIGLRFGRTHFEDLRFGVQVVAGPNRARPAQLIDTNSQDTVSRLEVAIDKQTHGQSRGMPAACCQSSENRFARGVVVEVVRLWIELPGERDNLVIVYPQTGSAIDLTCGIVLEILLGWLAIGHFSPELSTKRHYRQTSTGRVQ